jgi:hypothetical protein
MAKQVAATSDKKDDEELARIILDGMKTVEGKTELKILAYAKACEIAISAGAWDTAGHAVDALIETAPERRPEWERMRLAFCLARYNSSRGEKRKSAAEAYVSQLILVGDAELAAGKGDKALAEYQRALAMARSNRMPVVEDILAKIRTTGEEISRRRRIEQLEKQLKDKSESKELRRSLVMEYVLALDDPAGALKRLSPNSDLELRTYITCAARPVGELSEDECLELADWYRGLASGAQASKKKTANLRAVRYYEKFLSMHDKKDVARLKAKKELEQLRSQMGPGEAPKIPGGAIFHLSFDKDSVARKGTRWYIKNIVKKGAAGSGCVLRTVPKIVDSGGKRKGACRFEGTGDEINTDGDEMTVSQFAGTIALWVRASDIKGTRSIFHTEENRDRMIWTEAGRFRASMFDGRVFEILTGGAVDTAWHHLTLSWDINKGIILFYVDGRLVDSRKGPAWTTVVRGKPTIYGGERIADHDVPARKSFIGLIDEAWVWKRVLTPQEVAQLYGAGKAGN